MEFESNHCPKCKQDVKGKPMWRVVEIEDRSVDGYGDKRTLVAEYDSKPDALADVENRKSQAQRLSRPKHDYQIVKSIIVPHRKQTFRTEPNRKLAFSSFEPVVRVACPDELPTAPPDWARSIVETRKDPITGRKSYTYYMYDDEHA